MNTKTLFIPLFGSRRKRRMRSQTIGWISLWFVIIAGSTSTPFAKQLSGSLSPVSLLFLSELIALAFTVLSFGFIPLFEEIAKVKSNKLFAMITVGLLNSIIAPLLVFSGIQQTAAVNAELFIRAHTFFLFMLSIILLHEKINRTHILACSSIFFGILIVALRGFSNGLAMQTGDLLILSGALTYAVGGIIFKKQLRTMHPEVVIFFRGIIALTFFIILLPILKNNLVEEITNFPLIHIGAAIGYGFISRFLYLFSYYEAMERLEVHTVSLILPLITVGSLGFSAVYLGESIQWFHVLGAMFIIGGTLIMHFSGGFMSGKRLEHHLRHHQRHHI